MIPKRVSERLVRVIGKFQEVLQTAKDRDVNEADTVSIIKDVLAEVFGYDKYLDVTSEFAIRGTYCDLAIKINNKVEFLIEVKAIGLDLKETHLRQAIDYGANNGAQWVILTNGQYWELYRIRFEQPINCDKIFSFDFCALDARNEEHQEKLFLLCKEGLAKNARNDFHERLMAVNRFVVGALLLGDEVVNAIRRELKKFSEGVTVAPEEITKLLTNEVIKRDVLEGEDAVRAQSRVRRFYNKPTKRSKEPSVEKPVDVAPASPAVSIQQPLSGQTATAATQHAPTAP